MKTLKEKPDDEDEKKKEVHNKMKEVFKFESKIAKVKKDTRKLPAVLFWSYFLSTVRVPVGPLIYWKNRPKFKKYHPGEKITLKKISFPYKDTELSPY